MSKSVRRETRVTVLFDNDEVHRLLLKAAGAPSGVTTEIRDENGDAFFMGLQVVWSTTEAVEAKE
jgi:hypothetical protein